MPSVQKETARINTFPADLFRERCPSLQFPPDVPPGDVLIIRKSSLKETSAFSVSSKE